MDLMTTYIHDSELQAVTVSLLISTIHISPQHLQSLFQSALSSPAVPWQWLLTVKIVHLHAFRFSLHRLPYRTLSVAPVVFKISPRHGPHRDTLFPTVRLLLHISSLLWEHVYEPLPRNVFGIFAYLTVVA
jgi:hypothetical protein